MLSLRGGLHSLSFLGPEKKGGPSHPVTESLTPPPTLTATLGQVTELQELPNTSTCLQKR